MRAAAAILSLLLLSGPALGQISGRPYQPRAYAVTDLSLTPCDATVKGWVYEVYDGSDADDCATGGGSHAHSCQCNGSAWTALPIASEVPDGTGVTDRLAIWLDADSLTSDAAFDVHTTEPDLRIGSDTDAPSLLLLDTAATKSWGLLFQRSDDTLRVVRDGASYDPDQADALATFTAAGWLGVGTDSPSGELDLEGSGASTKAYVSNTAADGDTRLVLDNVGTRAWVLGQDDGDGDAFKIADQDSATWAGTWLRIDVGGQVRLPGETSLDPLATDGSGNLIQGTAPHGDGANCAAGNYPLGVDAAGVSQSCTPDDDQPESGEFGNANDLDASGNVVALSLSSDPANCTSTNLTFALGIDTGGVAQCSVAGEAPLDNRLVRSHGNTGIQGSGTTLDDAENLTGLNDVTVGGSLFDNSPALIGGGSNAQWSGTGAGARLGYSTSSRQFKEAIKRLAHGEASEMAAALTPRRFVWKRTGVPAFGLIAEEVAEVDSRLVTYFEGQPVSLDQPGLIAVLIGALAESNARIAALETRAEGLEHSTSRCIIE